MNTIEIAKAVLDNQKNEDGTLKYPNVQIVELKRGIERCEYDGPNNSFCHVQNKEQGLINKILASHEVSHFLNYEDGISDYKEVKRTNRWVIWGLMIILLTIATFVFGAMVGYKAWFLFSLLSSLASLIALPIVNKHLKIYSIDEQKTQDRAVRELLAINSEYALNLNEDEMVKEAQAFIDKHVYLVNKVVLRLLFGCTCSTIILNLYIAYQLYV